MSLESSFFDGASFIEDNGNNKTLVNGVDNNIT